MMAETSKVIHVRNVGDKISENDLLQLFQPFGVITKLVMLRAKNQALLQMQDISSAVNALQFYKTVLPNIRGKFVYVQFSSHQELTTMDHNAQALGDEDLSPYEDNNISHEDNASVSVNQKCEEVFDDLKVVFSSASLMVKTAKEQLASCNNDNISLKHSLVKEQVKFLNSANKEELMTLRGIGEKRATYILELREKSSEPFKSLDDLQEIGFSAKQIKTMMKGVGSQIFN